MRGDQDARRRGDRRCERGHTPVLRREVVELLAPERGGFFVDATVGAGGHSEALLAAGPDVRLLGLDRDPDALERARRRLEPFSSRVELRQGDFADLDELLGGFPAPDGVLADLGMSSMQLDTASRGFSFRREGPLDMRMGREGRTAADIVASASAEELTRIFRDYGEERMAAKIARGIVAERTSNPISTTRHLARIVARVKGTREKIDPATRVFQALRIEVNQELMALSRFLTQAVRAAQRARPAGGHLLSLPRRPDRQGSVPARVGRLHVPAPAADLRLRRAPGAARHDAAADRSERERDAGEPAVAQRPPARCRESRKGRDGRRALNP